MADFFAQLSIESLPGDFNGLLEPLRGWPASLPWPSPPDCRERECEAERDLASPFVERMSFLPTYEFEFMPLTRRFHHRFLPFCKLQ